METIRAVGWQERLQVEAAMTAWQPLQRAETGASTGETVERKVQPQELPVTLLGGAGEAWLLSGWLAEEWSGEIKMAAGVGQMTSSSLENPRRLSGLLKGHMLPCRIQASAVTGSPGGNLFIFLSSGSSTPELLQTAELDRYLGKEILLPFQFYPMVIASTGELVICG